MNEQAEECEKRRAEAEREGLSQQSPSLVPPSSHLEPARSFVRLAASDRPPLRSLARSLPYRGGLARRVGLI